MALPLDMLSGEEPEFSLECRQSSAEPLTEAEGTLADESLAFDVVLAASDGPGPATPERPDAGSNPQPGEAEPSEGPPLAAKSASGNVAGSFSRDLLDSYFRQMGERELLTRDGEVAL